MNVPPPPYEVVLLCAGGITSGKEVMALDLAVSLSEAGIRLGILTSIWGNGELARRLTALGLPFRRLRLGFISATLRWNEIRMTLHQLLFLPSLYWDYVRMIRQWQPRKCLHTNWHHLLLLYPFLRSKRDDFWIHECMPSSRQYRWLFRMLEPRIGHFVCVSACVAESIRSLGVADSKIRVIHNAVRDPVPTPRLSKPDTDLFHIGIVGQIAPWKGHQDLVEAVGQCRDRGIQIVLHLFGVGSEAFAEELRRSISTLHLEHLIVWHGYVTDRSTIFTQLDAVIAPSRFAEPFGLTAVEAGYFSLPVIVSRSGALPELVQHHTTGLIVEAQNPTALASAIVSLATQPQEARRLGRNARLHVERHFGHGRLVEDFCRLLSLPQNAVLNRVNDAVPS